MFENIASIDIGSSSIKVITVKTGFQDFKVKNFIYEDIDPENESREEALLAALGRITEENNLKNYTIVTNLPMQNAVIRNMTFPFNDRDKISEVIAFEAEDAIPFKLEETVMDFQMLKSREPDSGEVLLAAAKKETVEKQISYLKNSGISPVSMGLESQAVYECYRYFNKINDEAVIQLDIGNEKTILNFIHNGNLLFTRSIAIGINSIYNKICTTYRLSRVQAVKIFEEFKIDLTSFENNLQKNFQGLLNIKKNTLNGIYNNSLEIIFSLLEEIILSKKAFLNEYTDISFNRILISGGGSDITGIGSIISSELELPVISLPFFEEYTESKIKSQFQIAFGIILSYLNKKSEAISFLKGDFLPASSGSSIKQYYLAGAFIFLALIVLLINLIVTSYMKSETNRQYIEILNERYKKYFHARKESNDPVSDAMKLLKDEKKEFETIDSLVHYDENIMNVLNDILSFFPKDDSFELRNLVINESVLRLDAKIGSSIKIDEFKNKLTESKKFDSVAVNTNLKKGNDVLFAMTIKLKTTGKTAEKSK
ncbi:MAG: pilus assembly protein PilM [Spirochaetes bacterium]|nr:pilus assembly protein PilM [Spirochaetota bacterium]